MKENNLNGLNQYVLAIKKNRSLHKSMATSDSYIDTAMLVKLNSLCTPWCMLLGVVAQSSKLVKLLSQQPNICFVPCLPEA